MSIVLRNSRTMHRWWKQKGYFLKLWSKWLGAIIQSPCKDDHCITKENYSYTMLIGEIYYLTTPQQYWLAKWIYYWKHSWYKKFLIVYSCCIHMPTTTSKLASNLFQIQSFKNDKKEKQDLSSIEPSTWIMVIFASFTYSLHFLARAKSSLLFDIIMIDMHLN